MGKEIAKVAQTGLEKEFKENVDTMIANREYFKSQLESIMVESQDYHVIKGKKSLSKGGAEKLANGFRLSAKFRIDEDAKKAFDIAGLIAYRCELFDNNDKFKGEGGGADTLSRNSNDPNKTIKMAQKRAYVDAVIRTTGLSDIFTQDLEDMTNEQVEKIQPAQQPSFVKNPTAPASDSQKWKIKKMMEGLGLDMQWLESKAGKLETMKMGVASQVIEQLAAKEEKMLRESEGVQTGYENIPVIDADTGEIKEAIIEK